MLRIGHQADGTRVVTISTLRFKHRMERLGCVVFRGWLSLRGNPGGRCNLAFSLDMQLKNMQDEYTKGMVLKVSTTVIGWAKERKY